MGAVERKIKKHFTRSKRGFSVLITVSLIVMLALIVFLAFFRNVLPISGVVSFIVVVIFFIAYRIILNRTVKDFQIITQEVYLIDYSKTNIFKSKYEVGIINKEYFEANVWLWDQKDDFDYLVDTDQNKVQLFDVYDSYQKDAIELLCTSLTPAEDERMCPKPVGIKYALVGKYGVLLEITEL